MSRARPLLRTFPQLDPSLFISLADLPTPLERIPQLERGAPRYIKREDRTSAIYGGNKIRTLEGLFAQALASGAERIWSMGAYGSNHAVARSEEHTSELQSRPHLVCRLLLEKKKKSK